MTMQLEAFKDLLIGLGYTNVRATLAAPNTQIVNLILTPGSLRDEGGNWPAHVLLDKNGVVPGDMREFAGDLLISGVDLQRVEMTAAAKPAAKEPKPPPETSDEPKQDDAPATPPTEPEVKADEAKKSGAKKK